VVGVFFADAVRLPNYTLLLISKRFSDLQYDLFRHHEHKTKTDAKSADEIRIF